MGLFGAAELIFILPRGIRLQSSTEIQFDLRGIL